jgi:hypothetical protein
MCGYCIQSEYVLPISKSEDFIDRFMVDDLRFARLLSPVYLQESKSLPIAIDKIRQIKSVAGFAEIVFCRVWEMLLVHPGNAVYQILNNHFSSTDINAFLEKLRLNNDDLSTSLSDIKLYQDVDDWNQFISNEQHLINSAEKTLTSYYRWWLVGDNESAIESIVSRQGKTRDLGVMDNQGLNIPSIFHASFPTVYFSFLYLAKYKTGAEIIKKIALNNPYCVPEFDGYDLWLRRKALIVCVKKYGIQFITDNYNQIELDLVYYVLLRTRQTNNELAALKKHLISHHYKSTNLESSFVINVIKSMLQSTSR